VEIGGEGDSTKLEALQPVLKWLRPGWPPETISSQFYVDLPLQKRLAIQRSIAGLKREENSVLICLGMANVAGKAINANEPGCLFFLIA
jgi:hypothetical protein